MVQTASTLEEIKRNILRKITPSAKERKKVLSLADALVEKVRTAAENAGIEATVRVEGSVAKDTWLRDEPDIDIFMQLPTSTPREAFGSICLRIAKQATKGSRYVERFAEHPYLEAFVNSIRINIVPCYRTRPGEWMSATDRTPYHTDYVKPKLNDSLRREIRLLKRFMKGIAVYGAEIKMGGFSGYLGELLILRYGTFIDVLNGAAAWRKPWIVDYASHYKGVEDDIPRIFDDPLVVVDPVDKGRNVASAVRQQKLMEFVVASRQFLKGPSPGFFYPRPTKAFSEKQLVKKMKLFGTTLVFVRFGRVNTVPDILWGQLYKTQRSLHKMLDQNDFLVVRDAAWSNEKSLNLLIFEVDNRFRPNTKKHLGPPIEKRLECENFLEKHLNSPRTVSGPYLESGRWIVEIRREHTDIVELLRKKLKRGGRKTGVAALIAETLANSHEVLVDGEVLKTYSSSQDFAKFLTEYIKGRPKWL